MIQTFSKSDHERGYAVCTDCKVNIHTLQAGFDARRAVCDRCGCSVVSLREWNKTIDGAEIMSK